MSHHCDQCGKTFAEEPTRTATRTLCGECGEKWSGAAAALIAGGGVGEAIATEGWFQSLRRWRREQRD